MRTQSRMLCGMILGIVILISPLAVSVSVGDEHQPPTHGTGVSPRRSSDGPVSNEWQEQCELYASDAQTGDGFGYSLSVNGTRLLVGSPDDDDKGENAGAAYIFQNEGNWIQHAKLMASDGAAGDEFGSAVWLQGEYAFVAAPGDDDLGSESGTLYVFHEINGTWVEETKLQASDGAVSDFFGEALCADGDTVLVGAPFNDDVGNNTGAAYMFRHQGDQWVQEAVLVPSDHAALQLFGSAVSLHGDDAIIGAYHAASHGYFTGCAYVFTRTGTTWVEEQKLIASDASGYYEFGRSVAIGDGVALVGSPYHPRGGTQWVGMVYAFVRTGGQWVETQQLFASDATNDKLFGASMCMRGGQALVGAQGDDVIGMPGSAYLLKWDGVTWSQEDILSALGTSSSDFFGYAVSFDGSSAVIGAYKRGHVGCAYVFAPTHGISFAIFGGLGVHMVIINGGLNASSVGWEIHVNGGQNGMINRTIQGTTTIPAEGYRITRIWVFGVGRIQITGSVAGFKKIASGLQLFMVTIID